MGSPCWASQGKNISSLVLNCLRTEASLVLILLEQCSAKKITDQLGLYIVNIQINSFWCIWEKVFGSAHERGQSSTITSVGLLCNTTQFRRDARACLNAAIPDSTC